MSTSKKSKSDTSFNMSTNKYIILKEPKSIQEPENFFYKYISNKIVKEIYKAENVYEVEKILASHLRLCDISSDLKEKIVLDYYVGAMWFAKQQHLSEDQMAAMYILVYAQLKNIENRMSLLDNLIEMRNFFMPDDSTPCFTQSLQKNDHMNDADPDNKSNDISTGIPKNDKESGDTYIEVANKYNKVTISGTQQNDRASGDSNSEQINKPNNMSNAKEISVKNEQNFYESIFNIEQRREISKLFVTSLITVIFAFMKLSLYQHYKLYEYLFSNEKKTVNIANFLELELPASITLPNPLLESISQADYHLYQDLITLDKTEALIQQSAQLLVDSGRVLTDTSMEQYLLSQLSNVQIQQIISQVFDEVIKEYECTLSGNLDVFKNEFLNKINVIRALKTGP